MYLINWIRIISSYMYVHVHVHIKRRFAAIHVHVYASPVAPSSIVVIVQSGSLVLQSRICRTEPSLPALSLPCSGVHRRHVQPARAAGGAAGCLQPGPLRVRLHGGSLGGRRGGAPHDPLELIRHSSTSLELLGKVRQPSLAVTGSPSLAPQN